MGGQQPRLLLCSAAAVALIVGSLFFLRPLEDVSGAIMLDVGYELSGLAVRFAFRPTEELDYKPIIVPRTRMSSPQLAEPRPVAEPATSHRIPIRPPLPAPVPVPDDQIPVAPESGLTIRKRPTGSIPPERATQT